MLLCLVVAGCGPTGGPPPSYDAPALVPAAGSGLAAAGQVTIHVAAASDLSGVLEVLIERYREVEPRVHVVPVLGSSGQLVTQLEAGAPFDVFLAANESYVRDLVMKHQLAEGSARPYAVGTLVLAVSRGEPRVSLRALEDLLKPEIQHVAIANPEVAPYGAKARDVLQRARLWDRLEPKLVVAESVRQALSHVEKGDAEVGLVGHATARMAQVDVVELDASLEPTLVQAMGVLSRTEHAEEAGAFSRFLVGPEGRRIFQEHGFRVPDEP